MAGQRQPTDLVVMNGRKHLTKAEIEARKNAEVVAPNNKVKPPSYLTPEQKKKFRKIAKELLEIKLIANVDCDALARLLIAQDQYIEITQQTGTMQQQRQRNRESRQKSSRFLMIYTFMVCKKWRTESHE